ncbi:MAG: TolC family protein [Candidatus Cloacimonetes bacterium]|nr:TolC family protein [Candidatus Cloacimonadota bacterium]
MIKNIIIIALIIASTTCWAADNYSLEQLIEIALQNSYDSQYANTTLKNATGQVRSSYYNLLPSASAGLYRTRDFDLEPQEWSNSAQLSLSKSFSLNDPDFYNIITTGYEQQNAELNLVNSTKEVAFSVFSRYLDVLQNKTILAIQQKNLELQGKIHQQTTILYDNGKKSLLDLRQSEIYLIDYSIAVKDAEINLQKSRNLLFNYLNIADNGSELDTLMISTQLDPGEYSANITIQQKINNIKKQQVNLIQQKLDFLPELSLSYTLYHNNDTSFFESEKFYRSTNTFSLSATWNIFNLLQNNETHSILRRSLKLLQLDLSIYTKNLENNVQVINQELENLKTTSEMYLQKLTLARQNMDMAQQQYQLGTIGLIDLDRNRLDLQNAQLSYNTRYYDLIRKQQELNLLLSRPILDKW